jgi:hypothetical protein
MGMWRVCGPPWPGGKDPDTKGGSFRASCLAVAMNGHPGVVELLLAQPGITVNALNWSHNITALHVACKN